MYAYSVAPEHVSGIVDFNIPEGVEKTEIHYWRKSPNLHGWMHKLYQDNGGKSEEFNLDNVVLTLEDLDQLESDVRGGRLPNTTGFFFGQSSNDQSEIDDNLDFITKAREEINKGKVVYYTSWW
jgi:hypothetical protein